MRHTSHCFRSTRRQYHDQIAKTLETGSGNPAEARPEILAYHYTEAMKTEKAIHYWLEAGKRAAETSSTWKPPHTWRRASSSFAPCHPARNGMSGNSSCRSVTSAR